MWQLPVTQSFATRKWSQAHLQSLKKSAAIVFAGSAGSQEVLPTMNGKETLYFLHNARFGLDLAFDWLLNCLFNFVIRQTWHPPALFMICSAGYCSVSSIDLGRRE